MFSTALGLKLVMPAYQVWTTFTVQVQKIFAN